MKVLGIRCSNRDYAFGVLAGTKTKPETVECGTVRYPKGYSKPQSLKWFLQEIEAKVAKHDIGRMVVKRSERGTWGNAYEDRVEHEAMVSLAGANLGRKAVFKKVKSTIAKNLGLKGRGHYLKTTLDTSVIQGYDERSDKEKEAILAAWSELR
jgi:hypothetical protein